ncbi:MAG: EAL domain-containing protein [Alphaproteobacteria bacterium]
MLATQPKTLPPKNDLRRLTLRIGGALLLFSVLMLAVVAYAGWSANRTAVNREHQLVENALDNAVSRVLDEQKSIAWWDDAIKNLTGARVNTAWADVEYGAFLNETYHHDEVFVLNGDDEPVYAYVHGARVDPEAGYANERSLIANVVREVRQDRGSGLRPRALMFEAGRQRYRQSLGGLEPHWSGHIIAIDGKPAVVSVIAILPNVTPSLLQGTPYLLVSVVRVDPEFLRGVGDGLLLPDLKLNAAEQSGGALASEPFTADDGAPLGYLSWTTKQPGRPLLMFILPLVAFGVLAAGAMTGLMIRRLKHASTELAKREAQARYEAMHDALSGLPNRVQFVERLQHQLDAFVQIRNGGRVIVAYLDVDRFKDVNDTLGHHAGDALVSAVAQRLRAVLAPTDVLARFGGDEFAVIRPNARSDDAASLAASLRKACQASFDVCGQSLQVTVSVGIAQAPEHGLTPEELMRHADIALYQAKNQGRDRAMHFSEEMASELEHRREIELHLRAAIERDELSLHYQPLISCATGQVTGLEALLRWRHPERGDVSPAVFVPIAEEAGLMPALGGWVIERAFADSARWPGVEIAINLSPVQFRHVDLTDLLDRQAAKHRIDPSRILFEVTEGVLLESTDRNRFILEAIRSMGFNIALDDFGTGYSSLRYLADFRFDKIKIDRAFVTDINQRRRAMTIIQSVVALGRSLGMDIVAEGVETEAEANAMRLIGVTQLQGYYFSRAVEADRVADVIAAFKRATRASDAQPAAPVPASLRVG